MPPEGDGWDAPVLEGLLWGALLVFALLRTLRAPRGERAGWWLIAAGLVLIVVDKAFDIHAVAHDAGTWIATSIDPEHQLRGPHAVYRDATLLGGFLLACAAVVSWLRRDEHVGRNKVLCLCGLGLVGALLAARLMPQLEPYMLDWVTKPIELLAWCLVLGGTLAGRSSRPRHRPIIDGLV